MPLYISRHADALSRSSQKVSFISRLVLFLSFEGFPLAAYEGAGSLASVTATGMGH